MVKLHYTYGFAFNGNKKPIKPIGKEYVTKKHLVSRLASIFDVS